MKVTRFRVIPLTLYRVQAKLPVSLRDYDTQRALNRSSFDLKLHNGLVLPAVGDTFTGPNGMSLRPKGQVMEDLVRGFKVPEHALLHRH